MKKYATYDRVKIDSVVEQTIRVLAIVYPISLVQSVFLCVIIYQLSQKFIDLGFAGYAVATFALSFVIANAIFNRLMMMAEHIASLDSELTKEQQIAMYTMRRMIEAENAE
jgi:hypothetical protein